MPGPGSVTGGSTAQIQPPIQGGNNQANLRASNPQPNLANGSTPEHRSLSFVSPSSKSGINTETRALTLEATTAARGMFYNPSDTLKHELSSAAVVLQTLYAGLDTTLQQTLGTRILGNQGLMSGKTIQDLGNTLDRLVAGTDTATDRISLVALMGDIGALLADTGATTGVEGRSESSADELRSILQNNISGLSTENVDKMKALGDSKVVGPNKSNERVRTSGDLVGRQGLHGLGALADETLGVSEDDAIPVVSWQEASISTEKVTNTTEPLAGHMSGSPSEVLMVWDALLGDAHPYTGAHEATEAAQASGFTQVVSFHDESVGDSKGARLAATTAMLVAIGFHSPVENIESALKYTGQNPRPVLIEGELDDASNSLGHGAATTLFTELYESYTADE